MEKKCQRCGKTFEAERHLKRYCSDTCRQYAYLERNGLKIYRPPEMNSLSTEQKPVVKNVQPLINNKSFNDENDSKSERKTIRKHKVSIENEKETVNPVNDIPSDQLGELMQEMKELKEQVAKNNQQQITQPYREKSFQELLDERLKLHYGENMFTQENYCQWKYYDFKYANYVNERMKSHLNILLKFHKEGVAEFRYVKSVYDKLEELTKSWEYNHLPSDYPYREKINDFSKRLKKIIEQYNEDDEIEFRIRKSLRVEMRAMLIEMGKTVPDVDHTPPPKKSGDISQNSYYLKHKRMGFDILKEMDNL